MEQTLYLALVFLAIVVLLALRRPLYQALLGGLACAVLLYRIPLPAAVGQAVRVFTDWRSCSVLVSLYLITYLQRMLEAREKIRLARQDLNGLFHNRRINAAGAPPVHRPAALRCRYDPLRRYCEGRHRGIPERQRAGLCH
ncbi:MAG: hypothetical protein HFG01_10580 [Oscillibacter sp.]|jgi:hypothetical protein|nr:hypothetical protein [Oscillibacter sp.]